MVNSVYQFQFNAVSVARILCEVLYHTGVVRSHGLKFLVIHYADSLLTLKTAATDRCTVLFLTHSEMDTI